MSNIATRMVDWDTILAVLRAAHPKLDKYGRNLGGNTPDIIRILRDEDEIERIAQAIWDAETTYNAATANANQVIEAALKARSEALKNIKPKAGR